MLKLEGRFAIITGAGQGLGAEIAAHYVAQGASVLLCARTPGPLGEVGRRLSALATSDRRVLTQIADVSDASSVEALFETAGQQFPRLDILVNNAGVYGPIGPIESIDWQKWVEGININILGTVYPCRLAINTMKRQGHGKIINISGGGATSPMPRISAYAASKAAVVRFTETLALEVRDDHIDVNAVAPGALATRLTDQLLAEGPEAVGADLHRRISKVRQDGGTPLGKGAALCVWLASAESDGVTGRLLSAVWDDWETLPRHRGALAASDVYTLRRIVPEDRGHSWTRADG